MRFPCNLILAIAAAGLSIGPVSGEEIPPAPEELEQPRELMKAIPRIRKYLLEVPGRTGILTEKRRYSLFDEELIIRDFFQDRRGGFFVDVGCAWPTKANNSYYLERHLGWSGIGIDALADYADEWKATRPTSKFFNYLVTDHSGTNDLFFKSDGLGLSSTKRRNARGLKFGQDRAIEEIRVESTTLDDLLTREGVTKIDLLAMDIEGHELTALRGFDLARFEPKLVVAEGKRANVTAYLASHGYEMIERYQPFDPVNGYYRPTAKASDDSEKEH
jgi:FkbM family methyltransferase